MFPIAIGMYLVKLATFNTSLVGRYSDSVLVLYSCSNSVRWLEWFCVTAQTVYGGH